MADGGHLDKEKDPTKGMGGDLERVLEHHSETERKTSKRYKENERDKSSPEK